MTAPRGCRVAWPGARFEFDDPARATSAGSLFPSGRRVLKKLLNFDKWSGAREIAESHRAPGGRCSRWPGSTTSDRSVSTPTSAGWRAGCGGHARFAPCGGAHGPRRACAPVPLEGTPHRRRLPGGHRRRKQRAGASARDSPRAGASARWRTLDRNAPAAWLPFRRSGCRRCRGTKRPNGGCILEAA